MAVRQNERGPDDVFTVRLCPKCNEFYEADRTHICRKKNSYRMKIAEDTIYARPQSDGTRQDT